jgi:hypothetical protein
VEPGFRLRKYCRGKIHSEEVRCGKEATYDNVDFDVLWEIVTQDLPPLVAELEKISSSTS